MAVESEIQLNQEGSGPKVRTLELTEPSAVSAAGAAQADDTRHQQIVALADRRGNFVDSSLEVLNELRSINESLELILAALK